jgi:hypothetical protein
VWEAPFRGQVYTDPRDVKDAYMAISRTVHYNKTTTLRRYATENFVFDDQIADLTVVGDEMPNLGFKKGDRISVRLVHLFELEKSKITREIAPDPQSDTIMPYKTWPYKTLGNVIASRRTLGRVAPRPPRWPVSD